MLHDSHPEKGIEEFMYKVGNIIPFLDNTRGFCLDRYVNRIGSTGWDIIFNCIKGESFIQRALKRA